MLIDDEHPRDSQGFRTDLGPPPSIRLELPPTGEGSNGHKPILPGAGAAEIPGGEFVFDNDASTKAPVWGQGDRVLWSSGEPLMICAAPGLGKTTIAQQVALARLAPQGADVMGYRVNGTHKNVLYVAADRPKQASRSLRRMVAPEDREWLNEGLTIWDGPLSLPDLANICTERNCDTVFLDTLGAVVPNLSSDEAGQQVYHSLQAVVHAGIEVCVIHHARKQGDNFRGLDEVYGSRWITAVAGSIIFLQGEPGNDVVRFHHLKQPAAEVPACPLRHDHAEGRSYLEYL